MACDSTNTNLTGWHLSALLLLVVAPLAGMLALASAVWLVCEVVPWVNRDGGVFVAVATGLLSLGVAWTASGVVGATARWKGGRRLRRALWLVAAGGLAALVPLSFMIWRFWPSLVEGVPWPSLKGANGLIPLVLGAVALLGTAAAVIAIAGGSRLGLLPPTVRPRPRPKGIRVVRFSNIVSAKPLVVAALLGLAVASSHWLVPAGTAVPPAGPLGHRSIAEWVERLRHPQRRTAAAVQLESLGASAVPVWEALARAEPRPEDVHRDRVVEAALAARHWFLRAPMESSWWPAVDGEGQWRRTAAMGFEQLARRGEAPIETLVALPVQLGHLPEWADALRSALPEAARAIDEAVFDDGERGSQPYIWIRTLRYLRAGESTRAAVDDVVAEMARSDDDDLRRCSCPILPELGARAVPLMAFQLRSRSPGEQWLSAAVCTQSERIDDESLQRLRSIARGLSPDAASAARSAVLKHRPRDTTVWPVFHRELRQTSYVRDHQFHAIAALAGPAPARFQSALQALRSRVRFNQARLAKALIRVEAPVARMEFRRIVAAGSSVRSILLREPGFLATAHAAWTVEQALRNDRGLTGRIAAHAVDRGGLQSPVLLGLLARRLTWPSAADRIAAVRGLSAQRSEAATVRRLLKIPAAADSHPAVRAAALAGLARLGGDYARAVRFIRPRIASGPTADLLGIAAVVSWDTKLSRLLEPELRAYGRVAPRMDGWSVAAALRRAYYPDRVSTDHGVFAIWWH